jgi:uncharacterized protein
MRERALKAVADFIYRYHKWILVAGVLVSIFMGVCYSRLGLQLNFVDLLDRDSPEVKTFEYASRNFGTLAFLFLVLETDDLELGKKYSEALAPKLMKHPQFVKRVYSQHDVPFITDHLLFFVPEQDLRELAKFARENQQELKTLWSGPGLNNLLRLLDHSLYKVLARGELPEPERGMNLGTIFASQDELFNFLEQTVKDGPQDFESLEKKVTTSITGSRFGNLPFELSDPYMISKDRKHLLVLIAPPTEIGNFQVATEFVEVVNKELAAQDREIPGVRHYLTGNAAVMRDDNIVVRQDMIRTTLISYTLIILLFAFSFRNLSSIVFASVCLALGLVWSYGAAYLLVGYLTAITAVFGAILLGMGIDYAILILSRYTEERHQGATIQEALEITMTKTGKGILTGAAATSLAFYSISTGTFQGGKEMGLIAGTGIIIFFTIMTFILSSMMVFWDLRRSLKGVTQRQWDPKIMRLLNGLVTKAPLPVFTILLGFFGVMLYMIPKSQFEYNYLNMECQEAESVQLIKKIPDWFGLSTNFGMVLSENVEQDRQLAQQLWTKETTAQVDAISNYIPENPEQKKPSIDQIAGVLAAAEPKAEPKKGAEFRTGDVDELLKLLASLSEKMKGIEGLAYLSDYGDVEKSSKQSRDRINRLIEIIKSQPREKTARNLAGLNARLAEKTPEMLRRAGKISRAQAPTLAFLQKTHPAIVERFQGRDGKFLIYVYPNREIWSEHNMKAVVRDLKSVSPGAMGIGVLFDRILDQLKKDMARVALVALGVVFIIILLDYRGLWHTLLTMVPLVFAAVTMVGMMNVLKIKFNFVNIGMLPLIIGISIDYGVYVVHRWIGEGKGIDSIPKVVESTGRAVSLSALTTMIGFASIIPARWQGLSIMGKTLTVGVGFALLASVLMLPSLLLLIERLKARKG